LKGVVIWCATCLGLNRCFDLQKFFDLCATKKLAPAVTNRLGMFWVVAYAAQVRVIVKACQGRYLAKIDDWTVDLECTALGGCSVAFKHFWLPQEVGYCAAMR
jgi:hypothetical protein